VIANSPYRPLADLTSPELLRRAAEYRQMAIWSDALFKTFLMSAAVPARTRGFSLLSFLISKASNLSSDSVRSK
jgi:hypothetical protein